jgi:NAD(P)-dependent dehydrogenase (short-subunit alcohol dehydrogenase family)
MGLLSMFGAGKDLHHYVSDELLAKDLSGKTAIVTGATGSFGSIVSEALVKQGALVVLAVRRLEAGEVLAAEINSKQYPGKAVASRVDLSDLESITDFCSRFVEEHSSLHILVENAAVCCVGNSPTAKTGFEPHLAANHYGHIFMRHHLEPVLAASAPSRVVVVASALHDRMFTQEPTTLDLDADAAYLGWTTDPKIDQLKQWMAYSRSKLCNVLSALGASERLGAKGVSIVSLHPGVDPSTSLFRAMPKGAFVMRLLGRFIGVETTHQSVQTILYCCLEDHEKLQNGAFYSQWYQAKYRNGEHGGWPMASPNPIVTAENAAKLEALSYKALGLPPLAEGLKGAVTKPVEYSPNIEPTPLTNDAVPTN